jgi:opacity protein-like surface antigen
MRVVILAVAAVLFACGAQAEDAASASEASVPSPYTGWLGVGRTLSPSTTTVLKSGSTTLANVTTDGANSFGATAEVQYRRHQVFALGAELGWSRYTYQTGGKPDTQLSLLVIPKAFAKFGGWVGFGVGFMNTTIGEPSATVDSVTVNYDDKSALSLAISPRAGIDFRITESTFVGLMYAYISGGADLGITAISGTTAVKMTAETSRSWSLLSIRVGAAL